MRQFLAAAIAVILAAPPSAAGEFDTVEKLTNSYLDMLYSVCLNDGYRTDLLVSLAGQLRWPKLPKALLDVHRPPNPVAYFDGWIGTLPEFSPFPFFIYGSKAVEGNTQIETCSLYLRNANAREFVGVILEEPHKVLEDRDGFSEHTMIVTLDELPGAILTMTTENRGSQGRGVFASVAFLR